MSLGTQVVQGVGDIDATARRKALASGEACPRLRDGLQKPTSREVLLPMLAALWAAGHRTERPALARVARRGLFAVALGSLTSKTVKRVVCRPRPNDRADPTLWGESEGKRGSFPSGHATDITALVTVIGVHRGASLLTAAGIGLLGAVFWSSLASDRHWASDIAAGSLAGAASGLLAVALDRMVTETS